MKTHTIATILADMTFDYYNRDEAELHDEIADLETELEKADGTSIYYTCERIAELQLHRIG